MVSDLWTRIIVQEASRDCDSLLILSDVIVAQWKAKPEVEKHSYYEVRDRRIAGDSRLIQVVCGSRFGFSEIGLVFPANLFQVFPE